MSWSDIDRDELGTRLIGLITTEDGKDNDAPDPLTVSLTHDEIWAIYAALVP